MIRVLVCDDHAIVRRGLREVLDDASDIEAKEACSGAEAIALARSHPLDLVLLDIAMPDRDGLDVLRQFRREMPRLPVLILSTYPDKQYAVTCFRLGAAGYLNKGANLDLLLEAARRTAAGGLFVTPVQAELLAAGTRSRAVDGTSSALSRREQQVFRLIAEGLSVGRIAERLSISPNTVSTYRTRICEKTGASNDVEIALRAVREQLISV